MLHVATYIFSADLILMMELASLYNKRGLLSYPVNKISLLCGNKKSLVKVYVLLTYSMEQRTSWEAKRYSVNQKFLAFCGTRRFISTFTTWLRFYSEGFLAPRSTPKLQDNLLSAVCDCFFNTFAATLHIWAPLLCEQPQKAPCRFDRDPLVMEELWVTVSYHITNKQINKQTN